MQKIAVIGGGISGLSAAHLLSNRFDVTVFEKESSPGGLIRCEKVQGNLFHTCGGHVFNSKRQDVLDWFWSLFTCDVEFSLTDRNSVVFMDDGKRIPYPIENHMYLFEPDIQKNFINDLASIIKMESFSPTNFEEFLKNRFGETLYELYFKPYNEKVWQRELVDVPLSWLEGKLPMPTAQEMIYNNMNHIAEKSFVHSTFWYEKENGSQYIADKLAKGLNIYYNSEITSIEHNNGLWLINGNQYDKVIFCGNIKEMINLINGFEIPDSYKKEVENLEYHGTTAVFCEIDKNPYSWIYQPSRSHQSHRIICTGNFSTANNSNIPDNRITATIEFTDEIDKETILENLNRIPLHPTYLTHKYNKYTYPIQNSNTRDLIQQIKTILSPINFYFTGRFSDWEYYNMDVAIGAAMDLCKTL